eukprot:8160516-Pyramimonas_sp.AAC.3
MLHASQGRAARGPRPRFRVSLTDRACVARTRKALHASNLNARTAYSVAINPAIGSASDAAL